MIKFLDNVNKIIEFLEASFALKLILARISIHSLDLGCLESVPLEFSFQIFCVTLNEIFSLSVDQSSSVYQWGEIIIVHWVVRLNT